MVITSFSNSTVKRLTELQNKSKARKREGLFITEGIRECKEVPQDRVEEIFISETFENSGVSDNIFKEMLDKQGYTVLSDEVFKKVSTAKTPQGILCTVRINNTNIEDITSAEEGFYLILENLQDPGNMGTIIRTAEGASVNGIIISKDSVDIYNPKVVSATKGALFRMPCVISDDILMSVRYLKNKGVKTYAAHLKGKKYYCHLIADIYTGKLSNEIEDPVDIDTSLEWYYIEDIIGKLKLDYQNKILVNFLKSNALSKK